MRQLRDVGVEEEQVKNEGLKWIAGSPADGGTEGVDGKCMGVVA